MGRRRKILGIAAVGVALSCGPAVAQEARTPDPVAQVGSVAISGEEFEHWFAQAVQSHFGTAVELVAPDYARCVAVKRGQRVAKRWRWLSEPELRERCARDHRSLRRTTLQFLVQAQWVQQEAVRQRVAVGERRVNRLFKRQRRLAFPDRGGYERYLRESGASEGGIKYRIWLDALQNGLTRRLASRVRRVSRRDVTRYRADHPRMFAGMDRAKADRRIRALLLSRRQQLALSSYIERFRKRYRAMTWCATGYEIAECGAAAPSPPIAAGSTK
jgi:hypothetical protein